MLISVSGTKELSRVSAKLRAAGSEGKGLRRTMKRNIVAAVKPMQTAVKANALAIPAKGPDHTGLRRAIARATKIRIGTSSRNTMVRLWVNPALMPAGQETLPAHMEGDSSNGKWRHPVFGHASQPWVGQKSHPYFRPAVAPRIVGVRAAAVAAARETAASI
jgi:hypothetical protein